LNTVLTYKKTTFLVLVFKTIVFFGMIWLVYDKLWLPNQQIGYFDHLISVVNAGSIIYLIFCIMLAPINWLVESKKWRLLTSPFQSLSWPQTASSILSGITLGVLTPSRLGEYGGRLMHVREGCRGKALYAHFMGSLSQNIPILLFGSIAGAVYFSHHFPSSQLLSISLAFVLLSFTAVLILLYLQNEGITDKIFHKSWLKKYTKDFVPTKYNSNTLATVAFYSLFRYIIYVSQYLLLLYYFKINVSLPEGIVGVLVIFLFQTGLPLPPALSVLARTELALIVWSVYDTNQLSILTVPVLLWLINLLIPAIIGSIIILTSNIQKQLFNV
jgi:Lysylphosphatidylglycerol synthase TM region